MRGRSWGKRLLSSEGQLRIVLLSMEWWDSRAQAVHWRSWSQGTFSEEAAPAHIMSQVYIEFAEG
jgi:hypothetical protein